MNSDRCMVTENEILFRIAGVGINIRCAVSVLVDDTIHKDVSCTLVPRVWTDEPAEITEVYFSRTCWIFPWRHIRPSVHIGPSDNAKSGIFHILYALLGHTNNSSFTIESVPLAVAVYSCVPPIMISNIDISTYTTGHHSTSQRLGSNVCAHKTTPAERETQL